MTEAVEFILYKIGLLTRICIRLAGGDVDTAQRCPPRDHEVFRILALIMLATAAYQTAVFTLIGHRIFAADGPFNPAILLVAILISTFIMLIDSFSFMRAGWLSAGEADLARAGLDLRRGWSDQVKKGVSLAVRLILAIALAELLAIFLALIIFAADINVRLTDRFLKENVSGLGTVTMLVDGAIKRAEADVGTQAKRVAALASDMGNLRESAGGTSSNPQVKAAQADIDRSVAVEARAEDDLRAAEAIAADELAGAKGAGRSGQPGRGPRRRAAEERIASARIRVAAATRDIEAGRQRLEVLRKEVTASSDAGQARAAKELPRLEAQLAAEDARLTTARSQLKELVDGRGNAIRHGIESTPDHVPFDGGLIAQIKTLEQIADGDRKIQALIFLIGLVGFGFELAGVLAKLTTHTPTTYAALTVRDNYLGSVRIVDEMAEELDRRAAARAARQTAIPDAPEPDLAPKPSNDNTDALSELLADTGLVAEPPPAAPTKRPRGRPRKATLN